MWSNCVERGTDVATLACVPIIINNIIQAALVFAGIVALILIIFSGAMFITSKGDPQKVESARKTATWAIVGLFIIFLSFFIVGLISQITGVDQIRNPTI